MLWVELPWEGLLVYFLLLLSAGLLGWLPFRLLEHISLVDRIDVESVDSRQEPTESRVACYECGRSNEVSSIYCGRCGRRLYAGGS